VAFFYLLAPWGNKCSAHIFTADKVIYRASWTIKQPILVAMRTAGNSISFSLI
jgi:hypothetical protein